ncbi:hypothetical protein BD413DRAFT_493969 [Trametes elegans]|nr:hypothetical protein BD413DRAFT_493969 [Trametes elegans]
MYVPAPQGAIEYAGYPGAQLLHGAATSGQHGDYPAAQWHNSPSAPQQDIAPPDSTPLVVSQPGPTRRKHDGRRTFKVPLPPGTDKTYCETVATKDLLGLRCHDCVNNLQAASDKRSHPHIVQNVCGQERVMDEYFPGDRVSVHRTWAYRCTTTQFPGNGRSRVGCVFNRTSAKLTGNKEFCLGHLLTMMVRKLYHWWASEKGGMTQYRPLEYFVGEDEAGDMGDVGVNWDHIYIVAVRRWKRERESGEPQFCYFPEIHILI